MEGKLIRKKRVENYTILVNESLGEGTFGKVFKGYNENTKQQVAIKMLKKKQIDKDDYVRQALVSEIRVMSKLNSKHIVALKDVLQTSNNYYIVQEYCEGGDLRASIKRNKSFDEATATEIIAQVCAGFTALIEHGFIHRDMKPENILIHGGNYKIADFGFAKSVRSQNQLIKSSVGTPLYMSPQVLKQEKYSSKCDVWAIGIIFYQVTQLNQQLIPCILTCLQLVFGRIPWQARTEYELINKIATAPIKFPASVDCSSLYKKFVISCLQPEEKDRLSWREVLSHAIFRDRFKEYIDKVLRMEENAKYILNNIRLKVHQQNIDLERLFKKLRFTKDSSLKIEQLLLVLRYLDPEITIQDTGYIFKELDTDNSGTIEFQEFKECLEKSGVRLQCLNYQTMGAKQRRSIFAEITHLQSGNTLNPAMASYDEINSTKREEEDAKSRKLIVRLKKKIDSHKLNLYTVYNYYDKNKDDSLSINEFSYLLMKIDPSLNPEQCGIVFQKFDLNGDGNISFEEFYKIMCKIGGQHVNVQDK